MKKLLGMALVLMALVVAACGSDADGGTTVTAGPDDKGGTKTLQVGDTLEVRFELAGGTGYSWKVTTAADDAVLEAKGTEQEPIDDADENGPAMTGRPEESITTFEAVGAGETSFVMTLTSPGGEAEDTYELTVVVE